VIDFWHLNDSHVCLAAEQRPDCSGMINDRETGRPRGFGFMGVDDDALSAMIQNLDGQEMGGRALRVNEAQDRPRGGGGGRW